MVFGWMHSTILFVIFIVHCAYFFFKNDNGGKFFCLQNYNPSIFYPKRTDKPLYHALTTQCVKMGLSFIDTVPSAEEISRNYDVVVDALFGFSFQGPPRGDFATIINNVVNSQVPVLSVDVPSGSHCYSVCLIL